MWDILKQVLDNNRRELTLTGQDINGKLEDIQDGTSGLFTLTEINLLRICKSNLADMPEDLKYLNNLVNFVCQNNQLETFPKSVGELKKLTLLDLSGNKLKELPSELDQLELLQSLNVSCNSLKLLPSLNGCKLLASVDASHNEIVQFLDISGGLELLADVNLSNNKIEILPASVGVLPCIKKLELENNSITEIPGNVIDCPKLKVLMLCGNALKDRRLRKLVENPRTSPDQVIKYIKQHCPKQAITKPQDTTLDKREQDDAAPAVAEPSVPLGPTITISAPQEELYVTVTSEALALRPHLVCCVITNVDLQEDRFKRFIVAQNKLHEGICNKRLQSTIATHDLAKITYVVPATEDSKGREGLVYTAKPKNSLMFMPLNCRSKAVSAAKFLNSLQMEANQQRKQQKSNSLSGLYKYLQLVEGWRSFPCLLDATDEVLSVPPLTNSDKSKMSDTSNGLLMEVTSDKTLAVCKATMTELIQGLLDINPGRALAVQQVRVVGEDGGLRCVFPANDDLTGLPSNVQITRPGKK